MKFGVKKLKKILLYNLYKFEKGKAFIYWIQTQ